MTDRHAEPAHPGTWSANWIVSAYHLRSGQTGRRAKHSLVAAGGRLMTSALWPSAFAKLLKVLLGNQAARSSERVWFISVSSQKR